MGLAVERSWPKSAWKKKKEKKLDLCATLNRQATTTPQPWWKGNQLDPDDRAVKLHSNASSPFFFIFLIPSPCCSNQDDDDVERWRQPADAKDRDALWQEATERLREPLREFERELMPVHRLSALHEAQEHPEDDLFVMSRVVNLRYGCEDLFQCFTNLSRALLGKKLRPIAAPDKGLEVLDQFPVLLPAGAQVIPLTAALHRNLLKALHEELQDGAADAKSIQAMHVLVSVEAMQAESGRSLLQHALGPRTLR